MRTPIDPAVRFWSKVAKTDGCWEWTANRNNKGYGLFASKTDKTVSAHRFSYQLHFGEIPAGFFVCHSCDNRRCVNPAHLWLGTNSDNQKDSFRKGRMAPGNRAQKSVCKHGHPLTAENVVARKGGGRGCRECKRLANQSRPSRAEAA